MKLTATLFFFLLSISAFAAAPKDFEQWKTRIIKKFDKKGLSKTFLAKTFKQIDFQTEVIEKDRNQLTSDTTLVYPAWVKEWINTTPHRIEEGKRLLKKYRALLERVEKKYKVDKEVIVSLWGVETLYGKITGNYDVLNALATLAYDKRRRSFFERELFAALKILQEGHVTRKDFLGSWAGATGQCQFMPTNITAYAQDFDGDGKKDIWNNPADIFASIAYFLKKARWKQGKSIGLLAKKTKAKKFSYHTPRTPNQYHRLGVRAWNGAKLSGRWRRKIATVPQKDSPLILRGSNYRPLMRWNRSGLFAALNIILVDAFKSEK